MVAAVLNFAGSRGTGVQASSSADGGMARLRGRRLAWYVSSRASRRAASAKWERTAIANCVEVRLCALPVLPSRWGFPIPADAVIDQYRVSEDARSGIRSDPNRQDDPEYIVRLVGQVVRVSVEAVKIGAAPPAAFTT